MREFWKKINSYSYFIIAAFIIFIGIFIRANFYFADFPMWVDEIMLASSFTDRSFVDLFSPLDAYQKAPPLFFVFVLLIRKIFGISELSLRFIPFLLGILSLFLFFILLKKNIKNRIGVVTGLCLFTFCIPLIYFCSEFKPYGCDVFFTILLFLLYEYLDFSKIRIKQIFLYSFFAIFFIYISFPAIFIISAIIFAKLFDKNKADVKILWIFVPILAAGLLLFLNDLQTYSFLKEYWNNVEHGFSFCPSLSFAVNYVHDACKYYIYNFNTNFTLSILILIIGGFGVLVKERKEKALLIAFIMLSAITASMIGAYPLKPKLALYMLPIFIFLIAKLFDVTNYVNNLYKILINVSLIFCIIFTFGVNIPYLNVTQDQLVYYNNASGGRNKSAEDRKAVKNSCLRIINEYKENESILASEEFLYALRYYKSHYQKEKSEKKNIKILTFADIHDKKYTQEEYADYLTKTMYNKQFTADGMWIIGRNDEGYFHCPELNTVEDVLKANNKKYKLYRKNDLYLIYVIF